MKIVALSTDVSRYGLLTYFERGLRQLGHDVREISLFGSGWPLEALRGLPLAFRVAGRLKGAVTRFSAGALSARLVSAILEIRPDFVLITKGLGIPLQVFERLRDAAIPVINYHTDPIPHEDLEYLAIARLCAAVATYAREQIPGWYWYGVPRVAYIPFGADSEIHRPRTPPAERRAYFSSPIAYLATWQPYADFWPSKVVPFGLKIWGNQWHRLPSRSPLRACWQGERKGIENDFSLVCSAAQIIFNMVRARNGQSHSMKTFEIPACGGFMLANRTDEQVSFFPEDEAAVYFSTEDELLDKIRFYLSREAERSRIAKRGLEIAAKHTYLDRAQKLVELAASVG
ncbi:glycosyltransferase [Myxococcota bacterium]